MIAALQVSLDRRGNAKQRGVEIFALQDSAADDHGCQSSSD